MGGRLTIEFADFDRDRAQVSFDGEIINAANYAAQQTAQLALRDAVIAVTNGVITASLVAGNYVRTDLVKSNDPESQTFIQWRVWYEEDETGRRRSMRIPCADLALGITTYANGSDATILDISAGAGGTFKSAFEAYVKDDNGDDVTVLQVELVQ